MMNRTLAASALALSLAACSPPSQPGPAPAREAPAAPDTTVEAGPPNADPTATAPVDGGLQGGTDQWKTVASADDQDRIARLDDAWKKALREANHEFGAQLDALGMLSVPDAALDAPPLQPPPGKYRCRTIKVGSMTGEGLKYVAYPWFTKTTGSQRTRGLIYPDSDNPERLIYVGAQAWGDAETTFPAYGAQPERDQVGVIERIGTGRWRMVVPWPKQESKLDILEIRS
jgi:hypothetical protein